MSKKKRAPRAVRPKPRKVKIGDAITEAFSELMMLGEEMRAWADSLEEKFSTTEKYQNVSDTADTLEGLSEPDVDDVLSDIEVTIQDMTPVRRGHSRSERCSQAAHILDQCCQALEEFAASDDPDFPDTHADAADALRNELDGFKDEAEGCNFPGMYG